MKKKIFSLFGFINLLLLSCPFVFGDVIADTSFDSGITIVLFSICLLLLLLFYFMLLIIYFLRVKEKNQKNTDFNNNDDNKNE